MFATVGGQEQGDGAFGNFAALGGQTAAVTEPTDAPCRAASAGAVSWPRRPGIKARPRRRRHYCGISSHIVSRMHRG